MKTEPRIWNKTPQSEKRTDILSENRELGWMEIPNNCPAAIKEVIKNVRTRKLAGLPAELRMEPLPGVRKAEKRSLTELPVIDDETEEDDEVREQCSCSHCAGDMASEDECTTDDCPQCETLERVRAAIAL